jgi:hypothetical protein
MRDLRNFKSVAPCARSPPTSRTKGYTRNMSSSSNAFSLIALVALTGLVGCAADATEVPPSDVGGVVAPAGEEETATDDVTATKYYDCRGGDNSDWLSRFEIGLSATKIAITDLSKNAAPPDSGRIDRDYNPTPTYAGAVRFLGFDKIVEFAISDLNHLEIVVSKELKAKAANGKLWIRTTGGGGGSAQYHCKSKSAKIKVDTSKKSRLACSLKRIICTNDNPPGETCLSDVFLNQTTADDATLKLTYLDHFGVHVVERKVSLPASEIARTTKKVSGDWTANTLKLEHRGGVTYTGTFKLPDGRSEAVQCNDLAMFD